MSVHWICHLVNLATETYAPLSAIVSSLGIGRRTYSGVEQLLASDDLSQPGCVVAPLPPRGDIARTLIPELVARQSPLASVFLVERPDTRTIVEALQGGADDILDWPAESEHLPQALTAAHAASLRLQERMVQCTAAKNRLAQIGGGELEVLRLMLSGKANKNIAGQLGIAMRTVEARRKRIFSKFATRSIAEIAATLRDAEALQLEHDPAKSIRYLKSGLYLPQADAPHTEDAGE
ncbi:MAG: LuxR C-terminal-related transcriptional regulator [Planctomycetia bacterium]|nr:LuxR C-terminal-related transcriptional regulator [Planctomycetia bacterium]